MENREIIKMIQQRLEILYQLVDKLESGGGATEGYTKEETNALLSQKVDKRTGYSLVSNTDIAKIGDIDVISNEVDGIDSDLTAFRNTTNDSIAAINNTLTNDVVLGVKGNSESTYRKGNVNITKSNIGLGNVDNTSDLNKPISTATQAALNDKIDLDAAFGVGTIISATAAAPIDLDDMRTIGRYQCGATPSAYVSNQPNVGITTGFCLVITNNGLSSRFKQTIYYNAASLVGKFYERYLTSNGWSDWYVYEGTVVAAPTNATLTSMAPVSE